MKKLRIVAVIPARMQASRFPGKPLQKILDLPMIEHVRRRTEEVKILDEVFVATCDNEIRDVVQAYGGKVIMTANTHERCTDRIEEAAFHFDADVVVNVQGDEPMVHASAIEQVVQPFFEQHDLLTSCLVYPIIQPDELTSPNIVKVVLSNTKRILYLSRSAIPGRDQLPRTTYYKQSGIMAFTKSFLHKFRQLTPISLEAQESVDMLRVLEHDYWIQGVISNLETKGVDIPSQVKMIEDAILADPEQKTIYERILKK